MTAPTSQRLSELVSALIDEQLDDHGALELNRLLSASADNRAYYREQIDHHAQLNWLLRCAGTLSEDDRKDTASLLKKKRKLPAKPVLLALCAAILILGVLAPGFFTPSPQDPVTSGSSPKTSTILAQASGAQWLGALPQTLAGNQLAPAIHHLAEGFVRLDIGPAVRVFIEAPCSFEPVNNTLLRIHQGRINVEVEKAGHGFTIWTPAGDFIDLGTRFGIGVGVDESGNDVILSEVFTGEVRVDPHLRDDSVTETIFEGETRGLIGRRNFVEISHTVDERPIKLDFSRYEATSEIEKYKRQDAYNIALGKHVEKARYYDGYNGEIFPGSNLTDGRINDTGFPGSWSFWLAPNDQPTAEIIIDLGELCDIDTIQLLNTHNRHHRDRGTRDFTVSSAPESRRFTLIGADQLAKIHQKLTAEGPPAVETFTFPPRQARFVKVAVRSFYATTSNSSSAGLNEIRIFGPNLPPEIRNDILKDARPLRRPPAQSFNLALGRPVSSSGSFRSNFNANRTVDGLINDETISSSSYSCWLTPNGTGGQITIDLGEIQPLRLVEIQNTTNGTIHDRGTKDFRLLVSTDGTTFLEQGKGTLPPPTGSPSPFIPVSLEDVPVRFLKIVADSYYGHGAGLSEIRAFAAPTSHPSNDQ
ncbi:discoidin domain-containing protein [Verrucomicrobiaceae bacterium 227]